ncbi:enoyl-CoA hydratase/isomerase family protein [Rhodoferax mekongensis]|uniref:enoyl-CoA hydratase/isomerase family protein n=1 Tax=Rhodoferax mekongensis TaxID=3068341 RepID=UPI0028BEC9C6|nr:enoyl-CoA hydratase/isomerase family protein [Rhodoferax sp. TBRC 17199]MDT7515881.1 enoyl-CoA hydratase/isomerase family protein [Rhodoferax sp. TBRC 17199]
MAGGIAIERDAFGTPGVWRLTLTHTGKFNAMSRSMWAELKEVFTAVQQDASVRCVLLQGDQGHFCAGGDIAEYPSFRFDEAQLRHFHEQEVWGGLQAMLDCDVPIVARIEGNCMGAGMEIASCCDLRLAADTARFGAPIARLGFPMAPREAALVGQVAGATVARAMLLAAEVFDAAAMLDHGFLTRVHAPDTLDHACRDVAVRIAGLAPQAARLNKQTLRASNRPLTPVEYAQEAPELIASERAGVNPYAYADSAEHREGIAAFLAKRPPVF